MKKRILSTLLALCMVLALLPGTALAEGELPPEDSDYWKNLTLSKATELVNSIANKMATEDIILIYYSPTCPYCRAYVPQYAEVAAQKQLVVSGYADTGASSGDGARLSAIWKTGLITDTSIGWPVVIAYNGTTKATHAAHSVREKETFDKMLTDVGLGSEAPGPSITLINDGTIYSEAWTALRLTNQHRMSLGLNPLSTFDALQKVANQRAYEIYVDYRADHTRPDGNSCWTAYSDYGVSYSSAAENIASGYINGAAVVEGWLNSTGHRKNIEGSGYVHLGVGTYSGPTPSIATPTWSQNFASGTCAFSSLQLSKAAIPGSQGKDLEALLTEADVTVTATCSQHGSCKLPLIAAMCSGYQQDLAGVQTITVTYGGMTTTLTIQIPCTTHAYDEGIVTKGPTCTAEGVRTYTCTACGHTKTETIEKIPHIPSSTAKDNHDGTHSFICTVCKTVVSSADCTYDNGVVTKGPTCTAEGVKTYTCTVCGHTRTESMEKIPHTPDGKATNNHDGTHSFTCAVCKTTFSNADCTYGQGTEIKAPTCTDTGMVQYTCTFCGYERIEYVPATGHDWDEGLVTTDPTCTAEGVKTYTCKNDVSHIYTEPVSKTDHLWGDGVVTVPAEIGAPGEKLYTCTACGATRSETIPALPSVSPAPIVRPVLPAQPSKPVEEIDWPFTDVDKSDDFYEAVEYVYEKGLMVGTSDILFSPGALFNRAMVATIIFRMENSTFTAYQAIFTDVLEDAWYAEPVIWANNHGIVLGYGNNKFGPEDAVTVEQLLTILYRYTVAKDHDAAARGSLDGYSDSENISTYAVDAVSWAVARGLISGQGILNPRLPATRAQIAAILARYCQSAE